MQLSYGSSVSLRLLQRRHLACLHSFLHVHSAFLNVAYYILISASNQCQCYRALHGCTIYQSPFRCMDVQSTNHHSGAWMDNLPITIPVHGCTICPSPFQCMDVQSTNHHSSAWMYNLPITIPVHGNRANRYAAHIVQMSSLPGSAPSAVRLT